MKKHVLSERAQIVLMSILLLALMGSCAPLMLSALEHEQASRSYDGAALQAEMEMNRIVMGGE